MQPVPLLRELLRVDTTNPPGNEGPAAELLESHLRSAGLDTYIHKSSAGRPSILARIDGPTDVPALVLVSHTDVVAVERTGWSRDPFGGEESEGCIWGRGALDMKSVAVMHAAACAAIASSGKTPTREIVFMSVADEEAGGSEGAAAVLEEVPDKVGFSDGRPPPEALGEGAFGLSGVIDRPIMPIVVAEKAVLWLDLVASGDPGHGAMPPLDQANMNLVEMLAKIAGHGSPRVHPVMKEQFRILAEHASGPRKAVFKALASAAAAPVANALKKPLRAQGAMAALLSDTLTPTRIEAGYKHNVVPAEASASLDCRLLPDTDIPRLLRRLSRMGAKQGVKVREVSRHSSPVSRPGRLYELIEQVSQRLPERPVPVPSLTPGMTDLRYLRQRGATAYGWVPLVLTQEQLATVHAHDEHVEVEPFLRAVDAMSEVVLAAST